MLRGLKRALNWLGRLGRTLGEERRLLLIEDLSPNFGDSQEGSREAGFVRGFRQAVRRGARRARLDLYDAAILDLGLPDGDGLSLLKEVRVPAIPSPSRF